MASDDDVLERNLKKLIARGALPPGDQAARREEFLHRLGNLGLLQKGPNGRIGNKGFSEKKRILAASSFKLTSEIGAESDWTKGSIKNRQSRLADLSVDVWPRS